MSVHKVMLSTIKIYDLYVIHVNVDYQIFLKNIFFISQRFVRSFLCKFSKFLQFHFFFNYACLAHMDMLVRIRMRNCHEIVVTDLHERFKENTFFFNRERVALLRYGIPPNLSPCNPLNAAIFFRE